MDGHYLRSPSACALLMACLIVCPVPQVLAGCDIDLNGVAYGDCPSRNAPPARRTYVAPRPPSPEEIADQQAHALNDAGIAAENRHDWATAEASFKSALEKTPGDQVVLWNLAHAQAIEGSEAGDRHDYQTALRFYQQAQANDPPSDAADKEKYGYVIVGIQGYIDHDNRAQQQQQQEQQQRQQDQAAAASVQQSIQSQAQSVTAAPVSSGGMDFMASGPDMKDAVADSPSDKKTARGSFGDRIARPDLSTVHHQASGKKADTKAGDQARAAAASKDLNQNYDVGGASYSGSSSRSVDFVRDQSMIPATFTDREKSAPGMPEALHRLGDLQARRSQMETDIKKTTDERNAQKDPAKSAALTAKVDQETAAYQKSLKQITQEEGTVARIKRHVDATEGATPAQPAAAGK